MFFFITYFFCQFHNAITIHGSDTCLQAIEIIFQAKHTAKSSRVFCIHVRKKRPSTYTALISFKPYYNTIMTKTQF